MTPTPKELASSAAPRARVIHTTVPIAAGSIKQARVRARLRRLLLICVLVLGALSTVFTTQYLRQASDETVARTNRLLAGRPIASDLEQAPNLVASTLRKMLVEGRPEQALATLRQLPNMTRSQAAVFEVAALLETGDMHRANTLWQGLDSERDPGSPFQQRVERGLVAMQSGVRAALFDRNGTPVAYRTSDGRIKLNDTIDPKLLPKASLAVLPELGGARLTLDLALSDELLKALQDRVTRRVQGGVVILDANNAALLAATTTVPTSGSLAHDFLLSTREPASIAKLLTTSAALRAGFNPNAEIRRNRCNGGVQLGGQPLYCTSVGGRLSGLNEAMATSCNVAFALLGKRLGAGRLIDEYRRFGFADYAQREQPLYGHLLNTHPNPRQMGDLSIGLNMVEITPLHAAVMARTFVDGYLRTPHLLIAQDGLLGLSPQPAEIDRANQDLLGRIPAPLDYRNGETPLLIPEWLPILQSAMGAVADPGGTANGVEPSGFGVAMKTGTGSDAATGFHINYIGFAPKDDPQFAFALRLTHGRTSKRIRRQARAATTDILRILSRYQGRPVITDTDRSTRSTEPTAATGASATDSFDQQSSKVAAGAG